MLTLFNVNHQRAPNFETFQRQLSKVTQFWHFSASVIKLHPPGEDLLGWHVKGPCPQINTSEDEDNDGDEKVGDHDDDHKHDGDYNHNDH